MLRLSMPRERLQVSRDVPWTCPLQPCDTAEKTRSTSYACRVALYCRLCYPGVGVHYNLGTPGYGVYGVAEIRMSDRHPAVASGQNLYL